MAENILGLLLVTSSAQDRYVFRYPPDPTSPEVRLSQPVYSRATYTAKDTTVDTRPTHRLFPRGMHADGSRTSGSRGGGGLTVPPYSSAASSRPGLRSTRHLEGSDNSSAAMPASGSSLHSHLTQVGSSGNSGTDDSSSDDSDEDDRIFEGGGGYVPRRYSSEAESIRPNAPRGLSEILEGPRRSSLVESEATQRPGGAKKGKENGAFIEAQYNYALGYSLDFLADLLTPPRAACNRKFEVSVDELVFIGHPVSCNPDGRWAYPAEESSDEEDEPRRVSRGRRMNDTPGPRDASLRTVAEAPESPVSSRLLSDSNHSLFRAMSRNSVAASMSASGTEGSGTETPSRPNGKKLEDDKPVLQMFHLALILDKPDPQPDSDVTPNDTYKTVYQEIAFKWTAAAFALQVRDNWIATQARQITRIREKAISEGVPVVDCLRMCIEKTELGASLHELFSALHKVKSKPLNTLFSHLATTVNVNVSNIPISIAIPPREKDDEAALLANGDLDSSESDGEVDDAWSLTGADGALVARKQPHLNVEPWQALLVLNEHEADIHSAALRDGFRRDSKSQRAEDELMGALVRAADVTRPLHELAHQLRYDLEGIVIPLARELVQSKRAILVDVVNIRLRTILIPANVSQHLRSLDQHTNLWRMAFPSLGDLRAFISMVSFAPVPFRDLLPPEAQADPPKRDLYIRAITWLLRNDLVLQSHVRARVIVSPAVKETAWRRLWHRRRNKWLRERKASMTSTRSSLSRPSFTSPGTDASPKSDLITPRAVVVEQSNPMDGFATRVPRPSPPGVSTVLKREAARTATSVSNPLELRETTTFTSYLDYDSDLEMDSDVEGDEAPAGEGENAFAQFSVDETEPSIVPSFSSSFIFLPAHAQKDEARWLRVIREHTTDQVMRSRFDL